MAAVHSRDCFTFFVGSHKRFSFRFLKNGQLFAIFSIIAIGHLLFIFIALASDSQNNAESSHESLLQVIILHPQKAMHEFEPHASEINIRSDVLQSDFHIPDVKYSEIDKSGLDLSAVIQPDVHYELPNKNDDLYKDVFDPRLRKQLQDNHQLVSKPKESKLKSWTRSDGTVMVETGDGTCISKSPDRNGVATLWSMQLAGANCDKTQSEKMMDNINADLEARKHPLAQ